MKKVLTVIRKEYLERVRSKSFIIGTLLGPALTSLFVLLPMLMATTGGDDVRTVGVVDPAGMFYELLVQILEDRGETSVALQRMDVGPGGPDAAIAALKADVLAGDLHSGIFIEPGFMTSAEVVFYNKSVSSLVVRDEILRPALNRVLREARFSHADVPDSLFQYLSGRATWSSIVLAADGGEQEQDGAVSFAMAFILIMIIYMMVLIYGSHTLTAIIEEKSSRMVEVLLASVSPGHLMLGKVLGVGAAGLTQFSIWALAFFFISQRGVSVGGFSLDVAFLTPTILVSFVMFFILGFFLYATLYAGVGAMCNTVQDSQQFHTPLAMGMVIPMMMLMAVLRSPDSLWVVAMSLVPMFSPVIMFMRVCVETPPWWQIGLSWLLMFASILLAARIAGKLFRMGILMHGEAPTWATLWRVLRD